ncbi:integrase catalytic domain-containing protein [Trichonephila clavipes]|nr:integrase catalytic domain-containing protein [Trichonephila clavipes]
METYLGCTLIGKTHLLSEKEDTAMMVISMFVREATMSELFSLEVLGRSDPVEMKNKRERENLTKLHFEETVRINTEGRYEVSLPWQENHFPIPSNKEIAMKRLESSTKKLHQETLFTAYDDVFKEWELLGIIENDPVDSSTHLHGHYLPHRPVSENSQYTSSKFLRDDLITSLDNEAEILPFIEESHHILAEGKFNLRGWKYTGDDDPEQVTSVLGLIWNRKEDELKIN